MATHSIYAATGYQFEAIPDLSNLETRKRLSQSAMDGFIAVSRKWGLGSEQQGELLGGVPRSSLYKLRTAAGTLQPDQLTRISYIVAIYKDLHVLLPDDLADGWMTRPNDNLLFGGRAPLDYVLRAGIPGLQQMRSLLDAMRGDL